jgi:hypothetical protein
MSGDTSRPRKAAYRHTTLNMMAMATIVAPYTNVATGRRAGSLI